MKRFTIEPWRQDFGEKCYSDLSSALLAIGVMRVRITNTIGIEPIARPYEAGSHQCFSVFSTTTYGGIIPAAIGFGGLVVAE